jgi:hypothetical protein
LNSYNIKNLLKKVINNLANSIDTTVPGNDRITNIIRNNTIITGGCIPSLLTDETPNDFDIYFKNFKSLAIVTKYYIDKYNENNMNGDKYDLKLIVNKNETFDIVHLSDYSISFAENNNITTPFVKTLDYKYIENTDARLYIHIPNGIALNFNEDGAVINDNNGKYNIKCMTSNAITLTDKIQIIIRFYGSIYENFDFAHSTCYYDSEKNELVLPNKALESILTKELIYLGSEYPISSLIRMRKFINKGYHINASNILKICYNINKLDISNPVILTDQLIGVDYTYFASAIKRIKDDLKNNVISELTEPYMFDLLNKLESDGLEN